MRRCIVIAVTLLLTAGIAVGQVVKRAFCADDGKLHVVYRGGTEEVVSPERDQVGCDNVVVSNDGYTVGSLVLVDNCCTSYPIPVTVVVLRNHHKTVIPSGQSVWKWRFVDSGKQLAILSGPVHGRPAAATLYDGSSGKQLASWNGTGNAPQWAKEWEKEFQP